MQGLLDTAEREFRLEGRGTLESLLADERRRNASTTSALNNTGSSSDSEDGRFSGPTSINPYAHIAGGARPASNGTQHGPVSRGAKRQRAHSEMDNAGPRTGLLPPVRPDAATGQSEDFLRRRDAEALQQSAERDMQNGATICQYDGCTKPARSGARKFCRRHGEGRRCKTPGCNKVDVGGGNCRKHGGGRRCGADGCLKTDVGGGFCVSHGGGKRCQADDCAKGAQAGGLFCKSHGGGRRCRIEGCMTSAQSGADVLCIKHGGGKRCLVPDCQKLVRKNNRCTKHASQGAEIAPRHAPAARAVSVASAHAAAAPTTAASSTVKSSPASLPLSRPTRPESSLPGETSTPPAARPEGTIPHGPATEQLSGEESDFRPPLTSPPLPPPPPPGRESAGNSASRPLPSVPATMPTALQFLASNRYSARAGQFPRPRQLPRSGQLQRAGVGSADRRLSGLRQPTVAFDGKGALEATGSLLQESMSMDGIPDVAVACERSSSTDVSGVLQPREPLPGFSTIQMPSLGRDGGRSLEAGTPVESSASVGSFAQDRFSQPPAPLLQPPLPQPPLASAAPPAFPSSGSTASVPDVLGSDYRAASGRVSGLSNEEIMASTVLSRRLPGAIRYQDGRSPSSLPLTPPVPPPIPLPSLTPPVTAVPERTSAAGAGDTVGCCLRDATGNDVRPTDPSRPSCVGMASVQTNPSQAGVTTAAAPDVAPTPSAFLSTAPGGTGAAPIADGVSGEAAVNESLRSDSARERSCASADTPSQARVSPAAPPRSSCCGDRSSHRGAAERVSSGITALPDLPNRRKSTPSPSPAPKYVSLSVKGMMCMENCGQMVQSALGTVPGVRSVTVHFPTKTASVQLDPGAHVPICDLTEALEAIGFRSSCISTSTTDEPRLEESGVHAVWAIASALGLVDRGCAMAWGDPCNCGEDCACVNCPQHMKKVSHAVDLVLKAVDLGSSIKTPAPAPLDVATAGAD